ncbi:MAG: hypothetical protein RL375_403 [Pseudomonadota bacterium]|jgi:hypothetical protein
MTPSRRLCSARHLAPALATDSAAPTSGAAEPAPLRHPGRRSLLRALPALGLVGLLAACAGLPQVAADVSSYGVWPTGRSPGTYSFERLPSQARGGTEQDLLEAAARGALERAGFKPASAPDQADVLVQVGGRQGRVLDASPWFQFGVTGWWGGRRGPYYVGPRRIHPIYGPGPFIGPSASMFWGPWPADPTRDYREVALLLIDRASHTALVEVHVRQEARYVSDDTVGAMFDAALLGFPNLPEGERSVVVPLPAKG